MSKRCEKQLGRVKNRDRWGRNVKVVIKRSMVRKLRSWKQVNKTSNKPSKGTVNLRNPRITS